MALILNHAPSASPEPYGQSALFRNALAFALTIPRKFQRPSDSRAIQQIPIVKQANGKANDSWTVGTHEKKPKPEIGLWTIIFN